MMPSAVSRPGGSPQQGSTGCSKRKQHCSFCKNHNILQRKNGHDCKFKSCSCLLCRVSTKAQAAMRLQQALWRSLSRDGAKHEQHGLSSRQLCDKCRNHGEYHKKRGHKSKCKYETCACPRCDLTDKRRLVMKYQQRIRRANITSRAEPDSDDEEGGNSSDDPDNPPESNIIDEDSILGALNAVTKAIDNLPLIDLKPKNAAKIPKTKALHQGLPRKNVYTRRLPYPRPPSRPNTFSPTSDNYSMMSPNEQKPSPMGQDSQSYYHLGSPPSQQGTPSPMHSNEPLVTVKKEAPDEEFWQPHSDLLPKPSVSSAGIFSSSPQLYLNSMSSSYHVDINHPTSRQPAQMTLSSTHRSVLKPAMPFGSNTECNPECNHNFFKNSLGSCTLNRELESKEPLNLQLIRGENKSLEENNASALSNYARAYQKNSFFHKPLSNPELDRDHSNVLPPAMPPSALESLSLFNKIVFQRRFPESSARDSFPPYYPSGVGTSSLYRPPTSLHPGDHSAALSSPIQPYPVRLLPSPSDFRWSPSFLPFASHFPMLHPDALLHYPPVLLPSTQKP